MKEFATNFSIFTNGARSSLSVVIICLFILLTASSQAEVIDHKDSRVEYARSVSQLAESTNMSSEPLLEGSKGKPILVLFRSLNGTPEFDDYEPEVLVLGPHGCFTALYSSEDAAIAAMKYLKKIPGIVYAEIDGEVSATEGITDVDLIEIERDGEQRSFHSYGASEMGFGRVSLWCRRVGVGSATVAVIDSGVYPHSLISGRMNRSGFDYVDADEDATDDPFGHGTHVAGIIVDCTPDLPVFIHAIRVLDESGKGRVANTTSAIFEAAESGCKILNISLVSDNHSEALEDAIKYALSCGCTVVVAAGNNGQNTSNYCPVHMQDSGLIVVGACTGNLENPRQAAYSNYGSSVDVLAFGSSIESCTSSGGYASKTGTSQAAPHISALSAILRLLFPSIGNSQIEARVKDLANDSTLDIPNAALLVPKTMGVSAQDLYLPVGSTLKLLSEAIPETAFIGINWHSDNEAAVAIDSAMTLSCLAEGTVNIQGDGPANADIHLTVHVVDESLSFQMPSDVERIEREAFSSTAMKVVYLPENVRIIEEGAFSQSELRTFLYQGGSNLFEDFCESDICIVTNDQKELWKELRNAGIRYLIVRDQ